MLSLIVFQSKLYSQRFNEETINATILLEKYNTAFVPHGTGFLLYNYDAPGSYILVTCAHLLKGNEIYITVNADSFYYVAAKKQNIDTLDYHNDKWSIMDGKLRLKYKLNNKTFVSDTVLDIGAFVLTIPTMVVFKTNDTSRYSRVAGIPKSLIYKKDELKLGDGIYFIGFPFGIGSDNILEPLVRSGTIAWKSQFSKEFLLDAFSYGGNSGSPIFTKGDVYGQEQKLIGMIRGHYPGGDDNYGLAIARWIDDILPIAQKATQLYIDNNKK
jgi:hypothetical protein